MAPPDAPEPAGTQPAPVLPSGDYSLREELGRGGMGTVFRAELRRSAHGLPAGAEVAIKFLRRELADDVRAVERLQREGELGMAIDSPFIARIHGIIREQVLGLQVVGLVMELVRGPTLRRFVRERGPAVDDLVRRIGEDAAQGLAALHGDGLVHRDVKPENMALTPEGRVKLMDLGLAWTADARPSTAGFFGSIAYAAPEVLRGRPAVAASDLYSLGLVMYEMLTGQHPFADVLGDSDQLMAAHLERPPRRPAHVNARVSPFLEAVILDLLRKEPALRGFDAPRLAATLAAGEQAKFWLEHARDVPVQAALRRLSTVRRFAPTPFFGRRAELAQLRRRLDGVLTSRQGTAVRITGPYGIGRRRLLDEWIADALDRHGGRLEFVAGQGSQDPTSARGTPFPEMLADLLLDGDRPDSPNALPRAAARLAVLGGMDAREIDELAQVVVGMPSTLLPQARADLLARGLMATADAGRKPHALVVRVDRADSLDATAQLVVDRLLEKIEAHPMLLVLVQHLRQAHLPFPFHGIAVTGLDRAAFAAFARALFAHDDPAQVAPTEGQIDAAGTALGGSPGALLEALDDLGQHGVLAGRPGAFSGLPRDVEIRPAPPLLSRVRQRVRELPPEQRHVLQAAAVLGGRFPLADLVAMVGQPELQVLAALSAFQGRVLRAADDEVAFRHRDFRMALLDLVPRGTRRAMHRDAAWILERRQAPPLEVGMHMSRAMQHDAAVEPLLAGLGELVAAGARRAAGRVIARLRVHLDALADASDTVASRLRMHALGAEVAVLGRRLGEAGEHAQAALTCADRLGDDAARARALLVLAHVATVREQNLAAFSTLDAAEAAATAAGDPDLVAQACVRRAEIELQLGGGEAAAHNLRRARQTLHDDADGHLALLLAEAELALLRADFATARRRLDRAETLGERSGDALGTLRCMSLRTRLWATLGDSDRAEAELQATVDWSARVAGPRAVARAMLAVGELMALRDDVASARLHLHDALAAGHAAADMTTRETAVLWLRLLGIPTPRPRHGAPTLDDVPMVRALRCVVEAREARLRHDDATLRIWRQHAADLDGAVELPLHVRLLVLRTSGAHERAEEEASTATAAVPVMQRRRFGRLLATAARLVPPG
ncbi:MAG: protein kinase [Planctomycetota bacterium]